MAATTAAPRLSAPLRISLLYALVGAAWILVTDEALFMRDGLLPDTWAASVGKGLFFVLVSALLIFVLVRREVLRRQRSAAQLQAVLEAAPLGIVAVDAAGVITHWNQAAERKLGRSASSAVGRRARDFGMDAACLSGGEPEDVQVLRADGSTAPMRVFVARLQDPAPGCVVLLQDVTQQQQAEAAQRQVQKLDAVSRLAGGVAQEFNNILTAVLGHASLLAESMGVDDPRRDDVQEVRRAAERAAGMTRQLLIISGQYVAQPELIDPSAVVRGMRGAINRILGDAIATELRLDDAWTITADPSLLQQLLVNLLVNARDAMPDGGALTIETRNVSVSGDPSVPDGDYVLLRVADSGAGMDQATLDRLFEPFFTTKQQGSGLGLATVYGTVQQFGARIRIESTPGRGTAVLTYWPRVVAEAGARRDVVPAESPAARVLLVEDDPAVRDLAARVLRRAGHSVVAAASAEEALDLEAAGAAFDILVADIVMPGISGMQLAERLREHRPDLPVLLTSGNAAGSFRDAAELRDGTTFIEKPYSPAELLARVADLVAALR